MILSELYNLYKRLVDDDAGLPSLGWTKRRVLFRIVLNAEKPKIQVTRTDMIVPGGKRTSGHSPYFLCDTCEYILGIGVEGVTERSQKRHELFVEKHLNLGAKIKSDAYRALCSFLQNWKADQLESVLHESSIEFSDVSSGFGIFYYRDRDVHADGEIRKWWDENGYDWWWNTGNCCENTGVCLVTGEVKPIARIHEVPIVGISDKNAALVSFNRSAFLSYGKDQCGNAPVSREAAHGYACALNYLLSGSRTIRLENWTQERSQKRKRKGSVDKLIFWTDAPRGDSEIKDIFVGASNDPDILKVPEDQALVERVEDWLGRIAKGLTPVEGEEWEEWKGTHFYVLGLSPNSARLYARFFYQSSLAEWCERLVDHFKAMELRRYGDLKKPYEVTPCRVLREIRCNSPHYMDSLLGSIYHRTPYPNGVAVEVIRYIKLLSRRERDDEKNQSKKGRYQHLGRLYIPCSFLKAWLTRRNPSNNKLQPMLNEDNDHPGYVLGRLFAAFVAAQEHVLPGLNRTMQDSFYGSASTAPAVVFPKIMKLHQHHLSIMKEGSRIYYKKLVQEISNKLRDIFPKHLNLEEQGYFALGFYQQTYAIYTKK